MLEVLRRGLRWRWPVMLAIFLPTVVVGVTAIELRPEQAEAVSVVSVTPERPEVSGTDLVALTLGQYAVLLSAGRTLESVADDTGISLSTLEGAVDVNTSPDSSNLQISVRMPTEAESLDVANAMAAAAVDVGEDDTLMDARVLADATIQTPSLLTSPRLLELVLLVVAGVAALAVGYVLELTRPRIRTGGDAGVAAGAPVLGSLPRFVGPWPKKEVVSDEEILRATRELRSGFAANRRGVPTGGATCFVGSEPGSGTTTVAFLMARSISDRGESTVLVDCDLAGTGLSRLYELPHEHGLDDVLTDHAELAQAVTPEGGVAMIGTRSIADADDLLDRRLPDILKTAADEWDTVLLDTTSLLGGGSPEIVASHATSVLLVVPLGSLRVNVERSVARLDRLGVPVRGVVLNRASRAVAEASGVPLLREIRDA